MAEDRASAFDRKNKALRARLVREGKSRAFIKGLADFIRGKGIPKWIAGMALCRTAEFLPVDGSPPEFSQADYDWQMERFLKSASEPATPESAIRAHVGTTINRAAKALSDKEKEVAEWARLRKKVAVARSKGRSRVGEDEATVVRWIFANVDTPLDEIDPLDVPGTGALRLLRRVREDDRAYDEFVKTCFAKLLQKGLESDTVGGYEDDGRTQLKAMEKLGFIAPDVNLEQVAEIMNAEMDDAELYDDEEGEGPNAVDFEEEVPRLGEVPERPQEEHGVPPPTADGGPSL